MAQFIPFYALKRYAKYQRKSNELILSNNIQKIDFVQLLHPLLLLFGGKEAFFQKMTSYDNALWYSIFMQKNKYKKYLNEKSSHLIGLSFCTQN